MFAIALKIILGLLVFLAISSGITKIMLMPQETEFFGKYGFNDIMLIVFGVVQVIGGALMVIPKLRTYGASAVFVTFGISLILLILEGNYPVTAITLIAMVLLIVVIKKNHITSRSKMDAA